MAQIHRIMEINQLSTVTSEVADTAANPWSSASCDHHLPLKSRRHQALKITRCNVGIRRWVRLHGGLFHFQGCGTDWLTASRTTGDEGAEVGARLRALSGSRRVLLPDWITPSTRALVGQTARPRTGRSARQQPALALTQALACWAPPVAVAAEQAAATAARRRATVAAVEVQAVRRSRWNTRTPATARGRNSSVKAPPTT